MIIEMLKYSTLVLSLETVMLVLYVTMCVIKGLSRETKDENCLNFLFLKGEHNKSYFCIGNTILFFTLTFFNYLGKETQYLWLSWFE